MKVMNLKQVQVLLGISKSTLYKLTAQGKIPFRKPTNGKLFFIESEIMDWIESGKNN